MELVTIIVGVALGLVVVAIGVVFFVSRIPKG